MTRMTAFARTAQAVRVRRSKAALLPIARAEADRVSLQVHVALDAMRRKRGNLDAARTLCQVMIVTGLLIEAGYGDATFEQMKEAESILFAAFDRGRHSDVWMLEEEEFWHFATIVTTYDSQMRRAPLAAIIEAGHRLERFRAGESFDQMAYRRA
ncbi:hypothetical protein GCT13_43145 [Paraburkholderia sp. CNPSo 3157]|uniref:Fis family transcriptional regulator n=2 Tax=Paraburkholderia franconis TaxID=2654983 RepID=A0A7X1NJY9_9BURK|nr:hypothetical protein [Paraburkholderia franconis]MPW23372.1 hypothetical protein [Paraburkholderia franconis]